jgi:hypothetical protein
MAVQRRNSVRVFSRLPEIAFLGERIAGLAGPAVPGVHQSRTSRAKGERVY